MELFRKQVRAWLRTSPIKSFEDVISEARLTKRQLSVVKMKFLDGMLNYQIANELNVSVDTVDKDVKNAYKAVANVLKF